MKYTAFTIENYKGIRRASLSLSTTPSGNIYPLVGLNESGKTTILEAISSFKYGNETISPRALVESGPRDVHTLIPAYLRANFNGRIRLVVGIHLEESDIAAVEKQLETQHKFKLSRISPNITVSEVLTFKDSKIEGSRTLIEITVRGRGTADPKTRELDSKQPEWATAVNCILARLPRIWFFPDFLFDIPDEIYLDGVEGDSVIQRFYNQLLDDILGALKNGTNVSTHLLKRAQSPDTSDKQSLQKLLLDIGRELTDRVFSQWSAIFSRKLNARVRVVVGFNSAKRRHYLQIQIEDDDSVFDLKERSLGFRWFFVFLLLTSYRAMRPGESGGILFLFDEPASNLHSSAQQRLLESFRMLKGSTIIYTTHSHHLIDPAWLETTFVVRNAGLDLDQGIEKQTQRSADIQAQRYRQFVAAHPDQTSYFKPILDALDYVPSRLENVPNVVMVEGKNDFFALEYARAVLELGPIPLRLLPGGGSGSLDSLIRLYCGWGRDFIVLLDSDEEGTKQSKRYSSLFGPLVESRLFLLSDIDPTWKDFTTEDLFAQSDRDLIQNHCYPGEQFRKEHFYRSIQELFHRKIKLSCSDSTAANLKRALSFLSDKLAIAR